MQLKSGGTILIAVGIMMITYTELQFITTEKKTDSAITKIKREKDHTISWSSITGAVLLLSGFVIIVRDNKSVIKQ